MSSIEWKTNTHRNKNARALMICVSSLQATEHAIRRKINERRKQKTGCRDIWFLHERLFIMNYRVYAKRVAIQRHESILESLKIRHRKFQQRQNQTLLFGWWLLSDSYIQFWIKSYKIKSYKIIWIREFDEFIQCQKSGLFIFFTWMKENKNGLPWAKPLLEQSVWCSNSITNLWHYLYVGTAMQLSFELNRP